MHRSYYDHIYIYYNIIYHHITVQYIIYVCIPGIPGIIWWYIIYRIYDRVLYMIDAFIIKIIISFTVLIIIFLLNFLIFFHRKNYTTPARRHAVYAGTVSSLYTYHRVVIPGYSTVALPGSVLRVWYRTTVRCTVPGYSPGIGACFTHVPSQTWCNLAYSSSECSWARPACA